MNKAFVFGKFMPFHKGHEAMINFALTKCDFLTVLICCSEKEKFPVKMRSNWIIKNYENLPNLEVLVFEYNESELPNTSKASREASQLWSQRFLEILNGHSLLVSSEPYGEYVAEFMGIKHIPYDISRKSTPISASQIRQNIFDYWNYLPKSVKPDFAIKVAVLGTESTGKTTLVHKLAEYFSCTVVFEAGRDLIENTNSFEYDDLQIVAKEHAKRINAQVIGKSPLVILDTDIHITKSYARFIFDRQLKVDDEIERTNAALLYLYLNNDVQHVQDGTRLEEAERNLLDLSHRAVLSESNIEYIEISGDWKERFEKAVNSIEEIIKGQKNERKI